jgi:hypothetical protein
LDLEFNLADCNYHKNKNMGMETEIKIDGSRCLDGGRSYGGGDAEVEAICKWW